MKHLFLTGATGLVGRYLLRDLLSQQVPLAVLCRPNRMESAEQRVESLIERWERLGGRKLPRPVVLRGSLSEPGLGLDGTQRNWLSRNCETVLHNAASMTFREDKHGEPFRTNVEGMKNLLAVCEQAGLRQFHHVSTAYVCGLREGRVYENELDLGQQNGNVYEVSKLTAEKLVRGAEFLDQLTVYRPASVVGDSETGYTASSHGFYLPLQMAYVMADKVPPELMGERFFRLLGLTGEEGKNLVAVDWLSAAITRLVTRPEHHGQTYHLTNPRPVSVRLIQQVIREAIEKHSNKRFVGTPTEAELRGYEELFCQYMEIYRSHWRDDPTFDRTNTDRALADLPCTELRHKQMLAIASYPVKQKFIFNDSQHAVGDDEAEGVADGTSASSSSSSSASTVPQSAVASPDVPPAEVPIAIVGMACRLPGANNLEEYWQLIANGRSAIAEVPPERLDRSLYYDPRKGQRGKTYSTLGGMLDNRQFDRQACPIPSALERSVDNAHLLMCQVAAAACQQAGLDPFNLPLRNTGVYIGHAQGSDLSGKMVVGTCIEEAAQFLREVPAFQSLPADQQQATIDEFVGTIRDQALQRGPDSPDLAIHMVAGTISKAFGLTGPFMAVNSACASSLHTIQLAARALQLGRIDMAIVGGASDLKDGSLVLFSNAQSMTESGSRPFDDAADGLVIGEGYVALVLKTLPRALADGDPIQGIVMGIGASSDGRGKSLWAPRKEGQVAAMQRAYRGGLDMGTLQYVECHATSTSLGDATELNSLSEILAPHFSNGKKIPVASVKANIGHTLEAAGISGLIKTVLCMQHRTFAPAINIRSLNAKIDWNAAPIYVPLKSEAWPEQPDQSPRRAAVNAFGIGGLNVHLAVEEFTEDRRDALRAKWCGPTKKAVADADENAIAVIGMGCILPGAPDIERYWDLIRSGRDPKSSAPAERWRTDLFCDARARHAYRASNSIGGFIKDFAYDWKRHKVPPKQVEQADPLQFMLLDAAEQALNDAGYDKKEFDRTRTAVLVGTEFNGDFGAQLAVSLRLPELERLLQRLLADRNVPADRAAEVAAAFSETLLKHWPSLIDESGSFSTSTLASRITKTMNLMGGAASIDAGDASAAAALATGIDLLLSGDCDLLLCAGGQRSMNLPQFEAMTHCGILAKGVAPAAPFDADGTGIVPGEGVGMVLLKRLSDAQRDGDRIRAIIRGVGAAHSESPETSLKLAIARAFTMSNVKPTDVALLEVDGTGLPRHDKQQLNAIASVYAAEPRNAPLAVGSVTGQIGHTGGASAMASIIKASCEMAHGELPRTAGLKNPIASAAGDAIRLAASPLSIQPMADDGRRIAAVSSTGKGLSYHILLEHGERTPTNTMTTSPKQSSAAPIVVAKATEPLPHCVAKIYRFAGQTADELVQQVTRALSQFPAQSFAERDCFDAASLVRLAIVANGPEQLAEKLQSFLKQQQNAAGLAALEQQGCFYRQVSEQSPRVAFVFPGQGSQYPGMLRELVEQSPAAARTMATLDALLVERGFPTFEDLAWQRPELLGSDIWSTQLSMLLANLIAHAAVVEAGIRPDLITGHSYGEFAAITASGAWNLASVLAAARARVDGIEATPGARGAMLATSAPPQMVEQLAAALPDRAYLANYNSPEQTVVGGREESLRQLSKLLDVMGHKAQMIPVPCPFHTPLMEGTADVLRQMLPTLAIDPPRVPLLSSVTNRYVAEPDEIRDNLAAQLTTPVRYLDLITRVANDRDTVFIEVGPQQALTRLNRRILEGRSVPGIIAIDHPKRPGQEQLLHVRALLECVGAFATDGSATTNAPVFASEPRAKVAAKPRKGSISHVDGTELRRGKMRAAASSPGPAKVQPAQHLNGDGVAVKTTAPAPVAAESKRTQPARDPKELEQFLINFVVEQTGYPPEVVELDADLEADLGIDSIKKAQLFGELAEYFDVQPGEDMTLDDFPTLRHVTEFLQGAEFKKELASESAPQTLAPSPLPSKPAPVAVAPSAPRYQEAPRPTVAATRTAVSSVAVAEPAAVGQSLADLEQFLVNFVVEQTGYPPEVVELDADLEADLGIDSIKKAQLFGELAEYFDVRPDENMTLDDFPTLRHVVNFLARDDVKKKGLTQPADVAEDDEPVAEVAAAPAPASDRPATPYDLEDTSRDASLRYAMRILPSPFSAAIPAMPRWCGAAMIVGEGPSADALARLLSNANVKVVRLEVGDNLNQSLAQFEQIWNQQPIHHLFLMQGRDGGKLDPAERASWRDRRYQTVTFPFYLLQRWTQLAADAKLLDRCTLVAATSLGGDLGFSGKVVAPESGALTGLMKAIYIEYNVFRKFETFLAKAIDAPDDEDPETLAANICRELASRELDYEVAFVAGVRHVQNAYVRPPQPRQYADITPGSAWVLTGGARGITALCAMELGRRFDLQLHLLGSSPPPTIKPEWRALDESGLKSLQAAVMREARANNQSMDDAWSRVRKDLEIDRNLAQLKEAGIRAWYHQCDVADEAAVARVLDEVRQTSGPIEGVLHGAGVERSCNYERKKPEVFEATLATKVDGALNLMRLTSQDPLRFFMGFGSISGRLGSNGQTDYCLASDLLVKLSAWHRTWRPEVRSIGVHWHPWSDVGMAASPEVSKLLKLTNGPVPMDKSEGVRHMLRELYASDADTEILITDEEFCGRFYTTPHPARPLPEDETTDGPQEIASRHQMRLIDAPLPARGAGFPPANLGKDPQAGSLRHEAAQPLTGAACILGDNPAARALRDRLTEMQVPVELVPTTGSEADVLAAVERVYAQTRFQHLFLMTGRDDVPDLLRDWPARRAQGVTIPYRAAQQWLRQRRKAKDTSPSTISAATSLGGDFGIAGKIGVPDGGALCGLLKSLYLEDSRKPQRELRTKVIDCPAEEPPTAIADAILQELTHDDPNIEVAWSKGRRQVVRSFPQPAESLPRCPIEPGTVWVTTGGARGITATTAMELGKRYGAKLHLLGRSPAPQPDAIWRNYSDEQLTELKSQIVARAIAEGRSPEADWDRVRHDREIHENLEKFAAAGVTFTYHSCDVANREQLADVLDQIRRTAGRIDGILHGAGWARPGRFDSRSPQVIEKTFTGKLDGAINLMALTAADPIRYWIGFGSISGRYGGNGLSDYAAANDMLAKLLAWYRQRRPECAACCIHWQSWDEVGMSIHSDSSTVGAKGVLKMEFISPREGNAHLCRELDAGLPSAETIISDGYFERIFYPHIQAEQESVQQAEFAIVDSTTPIGGAPAILAHVQFDPDSDPFLYDHTLRGKPLLPAVVGMEAMAEAAALLTSKRVVTLRQVEFQTGLPFQPGRPIAARVRAERTESGAVSCHLLTDFKNRAGVVVQKDRVHFVGLADVADAMPTLNAAYSNPTTDWHPFEFRTDGLMVHGPTFQGVNRVTFDGDMCWGELTALSLGNLGGSHRKNNWLVPATLVDAAFYVCSIHLWLHVEPVPALPQSIEVLRLGRMPRDGEPIWVHGRCRAVQEGHVIYDFALFDQQRLPIAQVEGFRCVMIKANAGATVDS